MINLLLQILQTPVTLKHHADSIHNIASTVVKDVTTGEGLDKMQLLLQKLLDWSISMGGRVVAAIIIFIIGRYLIKIINRLLQKLFVRQSVDPSIKTFLGSFINTTLMVLLIIAIINKLGIETTSFAALLASFGVAIGMAMSGNLSNFVGGMLILLFKPYKVGDWIKVDNTLGLVISIETFHTILRTYDGTHVYFSNGNMSSVTVRNYSKEDIIREEFKLGLEYGQDLVKAEQVLKKIVEDEKRALPDPKPTFVFDSFGDSSINIILRLWVKNEDYWDVKSDIQRRIYEEFNREGISFPFPHITLHQPS